MKKILLVDDDIELGEMITQYLANYGYEVVVKTTTEGVCDQIRKSNPELIILDIMLPGKNGLDLCKEIRAMSNVPILFLSARGGVTDRVVGLELGADDFLPKPFDPRELVARVETILRRVTSKSVGQILISQELEIHLDRQEALLSGEVLDLTTSEFELLKLFATHPGEVLDRDQIQDQLRGITWDTLDRSIDICVSRLRQKLSDSPKQPQYLKTIWGKGYLFLGRVTRVS